MNAAPRHIAFIMDGNGRWALERGKKRLEGHRKGVETLDNLLHWTREAGVEYVSVYAFSTENWRRPKDEVDGLMRLLGWYVRHKKKQLVKDSVRFRVMGRKADLPPRLVAALEDLEEVTKAGRYQLIVCLSYGGRAEIVDAAKRFAALPPEERTEEAFKSCLYLPDVPDPDLIVRTSGEFRVSNFLLWECAYSEFYVTPVLWPDFSEADFRAALEAYSKRERRMGGHK